MWMRIVVMLAAACCAAEWEEGKVVRISRQPFAGEQNKHGMVYTVAFPAREVSFVVSNKTAFTGYPKNPLFAIGDTVRLRLDGDSKVDVKRKDGKEGSYLLQSESWFAEPAKK
jgi:hypothetical protein